MTETDKLSENPGDEWLKTQQNFWNAWSDLARQSTLGGETDGQELPWSDALNKWSEAVFSGVPDQNRDLYEKFVEQGKTFFDMSQKFSGVLGRLTRVSDSSEDWKNELEDMFVEFKKTFLQPVSGVSTSAISPDALFPNLDFAGGDNLFAKMAREMEVYLLMPGLKFTGEWQEQSQETARLAVEHRKVLDEYNEYYKVIVSDGLDRLQQKLVDYGETGKEITSLYQLYNLWVDCNEDAYADRVYSSEYSALYGRLINSMMKLRSSMQESVDNTQD